MAIKTEIRHTVHDIELVIYDEHETGAAVVVNTITDLENIRNSIDKLYLLAGKRAAESEQKRRWND